MDDLAHTFWKDAHMRVVHTVNGRQHVHYELRKAVEGSEKDKSSSGKYKAETYEDACLISVNNYKTIPVFYKKQVYYRYVQSCPVIYSDPDYLPPKA